MAILFAALLAFLFQIVHAAPVEEAAPQQEATAPEASAADA